MNRNEAKMPDLFNVFQGLLRQLVPASVADACFAGQVAGHLT